MTEIDKVLANIRTYGEWLEPASSDAAAPDPNDQHLWNLLASRSTAVLVTGDRKLLEQPPEGSTVLLPRDFLEGLIR